MFKSCGWVMVGLAIALLVGCAASRTTGGVLPGQTVKASGKVIVLPVADGTERAGDAAVGSGAATTAALRDALIQNGQIPVVSEVTSLPAAMQEAMALNYDYVLKVTIIEWEDNATAMSGNPDSAAISAELYDPQSKQLVSTATHRERASAMAIASARPDRFIPQLSTSVVKALFASPQAKTAAGR